QTAHEIVGVAGGVADVDRDGLLCEVALLRVAWQNANARGRHCAQHDPANVRHAILQKTPLRPARCERQVLHRLPELACGCATVTQATDRSSPRGPPWWQMDAIRKTAISNRSKVTSASCITGGLAHQLKP